MVTVPVKNGQPAEQKAITAAPPRVGNLTARDRCDAAFRVPLGLEIENKLDVRSCGARAYVGAEIHGVDLLFCKHHFERYETAIRAIADEILDERWQLDDGERRRKAEGVSA
jgi:hypothetical protein